MARVRVELNSHGIGNFLADSPVMKRAVNDAAEEVERAMIPSIEDTRSRASIAGGKHKKVKPTYDQKVGVRESHGADGRYKAEVYVENMSNADFIFGTIPNAVVKAGGRRARR